MALWLPIKQRHGLMIEVWTPLDELGGAEKSQSGASCTQQLRVRVLGRNG